MEGEPTPKPSVRDFALSDGAGRAADIRSHGRARVRRRYKRFLRGPVQWSWLLAASKHKAGAMCVALGLWRKAGMRNEMTVKVSMNALAKEFGYEQSTMSRGLAALERAGLVRVTRSPGAAPMVTIIEIDETKDEP